MSDYQSRLEAVTTLMCAAIDRAEAWYCELLAKRYAGQVVTGKDKDKLAELDRLALHSVEAYCRLAQEATR